MMTQTQEQQQEMFNIINDVQIGILDESKMNKLKTWFIQGNGIYEIYKNEIGTFGFKRSEINIPGLPNQFNKEVLFQFSKPKIPMKFYNQILSFFRAVMKKYDNAEAFLQIFFDKENQEYLVYVPEQQVSGARVSYDNSKNPYLINPDRYVFVFECHSHNNMGAFWSGTDNADEKELRFYGVFGKLNSKNYEEKFRIIINGVSVALQAEDIFDLKDMEVDFPEEWLQNIQTIPVSNHSYNAFQNYKNNLIQKQNQTPSIKNKVYKEETIDMFDDQELDDEENEEKEEEMIEILEALEDLTDNFSNLEEIHNLVEALDQYYYLDSIEEVIREYRMTDALNHNQEGYAFPR